MKTFGAVCKVVRARKVPARWPSFPSGPLLQGVGIVAVTASLVRALGKILVPRVPRSPDMGSGCIRQCKDLLC